MMVFSKSRSKTSLHKLFLFCFFACFCYISINFSFFSENAQAWKVCKVTSSGIGTDCRQIDWVRDYTWNICDVDFNNCIEKELEHREISIHGVEGDYTLVNNIAAMCAIDFPPYSRDPNNCWEMSGNAWLDCSTWENGVSNCHVESEVNEDLVWNTVRSSRPVKEYLFIRPASDLVKSKKGTEQHYVGTLHERDMIFRNIQNYDNLYNFAITKEEVKQNDDTPSYKYKYIAGNKVIEYAEYSIEACVEYHWTGEYGGGFSTFWEDECSFHSVKETDNGYLKFSAESKVATVNNNDVSNKQWNKDSSSQAKDFEGVNEGTVTIGFNHKIKSGSEDLRNVPIRTEIGTQVRINRFVNGSATTTTEWTNYYGPGGNRVNDAWQRIQTYNSNDVSIIGDNVTLNNFKLGEQAEVCQRIAYDNIIKVTTVTNEDGSKTTTTQPMATANNNYTILKDEEGNEIVAALPSAYSNWACVTVRAINNRHEYVGYSAVHYGSEQKSTDWTKIDATAEKSLPSDNCSNGCEVTFSHGLKNIYAEGIEAGSNYTLHKVRKDVNNKYLTKYDQTKSGTLYGGEEQWTKIDKTIVYPGEMVCEWLEFDSVLGSTVPNSNVIDYRNKTTTKACAYIVAEFGSSIDVKIQNPAISTEWSDTSVFARPGNEIYLKGSFSPEYQHTKDFIPAYTQIGGRYGSIVANNTKSVQNTFNSYYTNSAYHWNNAFSLKSYELSSCSALFKSGLGDDSTYNRQTSFTVSVNSAGKELEASAVTNSCYNRSNTTLNGHTTPKGVSFTRKNSEFTAVVDTDPVTDVVKYKVPYNFNTAIIIPSLADKEKIIFAGESKEVKNFIVRVETRTNKLLNDTYATIMRSAKTRLISYTLESGNPRAGTDKFGYKDTRGDSLCNYFGGSSSCGLSTISSYTFNENGYLNGAEKTVLAKTIKASDERAGTKICVALALYPSDSGYDDSIDVKGNEHWRISDSVCYTVAKKPSLQVWGGNFYSSGKVSTFVSTKYNLKGQGEVDWTNDNSSAYVFGSWVEGAIVSNGEVRGLASGAGTGYKKSETDMAVGGVNGKGASINFCVRSPLSFATVSGNCNSLTGYVGKIGKSTQPGDKAEILERFVSYDDGEAAKNAGIVKDENDYVVLNNETISGMSIQKGTTKIFKRNGTINITGDIIYDGSYNSLAEVPKVIIYANGNIDISCNVTRIDALLISDETVETCYEVHNNTDNNEKIQSNQLKINGAIIANKLIARRTYGASTGKNSVIPAEIVDYDSTFYLWGAKNAEAAKSGTLSNVYLRELSPRY